jgi:predicted dehydrogenase
MAAAFSSSGLPLYLEKPVAINRDQLNLLAQSFLGRERSVVVSFPLRCTPLFTRVREIVASGVLGTITQVQAINNVPYGGVYFGQWYRDHDETGGLWLQKATHDFDYIHQVVGARPVRVAAVGSRRAYGGDRPDDLRCSECDRTESCPESPANSKRRGDHGGMGSDDHWCAFSRSIRHHDCGSALITYDNGVHASYSQNFVSRREAARRGAIITGYLATVEFDWYQNAGRLIHHHERNLERFEVPPAEGHAGGDDVLLKNFIDVASGRDVSHSDLYAGILSVAMCLAAQKSEETATFQSIVLPGDEEQESVRRLAEQHT